MSENLLNPDLPPGAVAKIKQGTPVRNDGKRLKPAEGNRWYVLATIAGVQEGTFPPWEADEELAAKNRRFWNGWACGEMSDEERAALAEKMDLSVEELAPLSADERAHLEREFRKRLGPDLAIPEPSETIDFQETHFPHNRVWGKCVFPADASFDSATFSGAADFESATFGETASFGSATFSGRASFTDAVIEGSMAFTDCVFETPATFRKARFVNFVPAFEGTILHGTTFFSADVEGWPIVGQNDPQEGKEACAVIRHVVGKQSRPDDEHFFFRKEMAFAERAGNWAYAWPIKVYRRVSDYGFSIGRPLLALTALWIVPALIYLAVFNWVCIRDDGVCYSTGFPFGLSFSNIFAFLGFGRLFFRDFFLEDAGAWLVFFSGAQTVLGFALLFFLGLGLRNRFRLK